MKPSKNVVEAWVQLNLILVNVLEKLLRSQHFGDSNQLE